MSERDLFIGQIFNRSTMLARHLVTAMNKLDTVMTEKVVLAMSDRMDRRDRSKVSFEQKVNNELAISSA